MRAEGLIKGTRTPGAARTLRSSRKNPSVPSSSCPQRGLAVVYPPGAWHGLVTQQQNGERRGGSCCRVRAAPAAAPSSRDSSKDSIPQPEVKEKPSLPSQRLLQSLPPAEILLPERAQPRMPNTEGGAALFPRVGGLRFAPCPSPLPRASPFRGVRAVPARRDGPGTPGCGEGCGEGCGDGCRDAGVSMLPLRTPAPRLRHPRPGPAEPGWRSAPGAAAARTRPLRSAGSCSRGSASQGGEMLAMSPRAPSERLGSVFPAQISV